jgi:hypothetical protein
MRRRRRRVKDDIAAIGILLDVGDAVRRRCDPGCSSSLKAGRYIASADEQGAF